MTEEKAFISSTVLDLPEHRAEVLNACLRQGVFPVMMEHWPAASAEAVEVSLSMVETASIYVGVFGHRYGHVPDGAGKSLTEMEYERACELGHTRLIFLMADDHLLRAEDVETGVGAARLQAFKERLAREQVVAFFSSKEDLRAKVIDSLANLRLRRSEPESLHFVSDIPTPPEPYVAHPYTLLPTSDLVGRRAEVNLLTDWIAQPDSPLYGARVLAIVAIGGMGKSALTWKWFRDVAGYEMSPLAGRIWWSFYESDATFENFVIRALAYVARLPRHKVQTMAAPEREELLLSLLDREPFLLVLDGLERIMIAYARMDASRLQDDDLDDRTDNVVLGGLGLPRKATTPFEARHRLRKTADPRAGAFLRKLAQVRGTRTLISSRLYPAELQAENGAEVPGARSIFLNGLTDDDALELWRSTGVSGSRLDLQPLLRSFENFPLLIRALSGEISRFRPAPGDFDAWRAANPEFDPFKLPLTQRRSHVLAFAFRGLGRSTRKVLVTLAGFRMPATWRTLADLLVGPDRPFEHESSLDAALTELEDRGLVGWDRRSNRYDLHPVVRGVTWQSLGRVGQRIIYENLESHFEALPTGSDVEVTSLDQLTPVIELYHVLIGLERYDTAFSVFEQYLFKPVLVRLGECRKAAEWLEGLFPEGLSAPPLGSGRDRQSALHMLAYAYHYSGQIELASTIWESTGRWSSASVSLLPSGALRRAEVAARKAHLSDPRAPEELRNLGWIFSIRGVDQAAAKAFDRSFELFDDKRKDDEHETFGYVRGARHALDVGDLERAAQWGAKAWRLAEELVLERPSIMAMNLEGAILLAQGSTAQAKEVLLRGLRRARRINFTAAEIDALLDLTRACLQLGEEDVCREALADLWEPVERGRFRLAEADGLLLLARLELKKQDVEKAVDAASRAYRTAWCDGPPFAYHRTLCRSGDLLADLGAEPPTGLPPFSEDEHEPLPEVPIIDDPPE